MPGPSGRARRHRERAYGGGRRRGGGRGGAGRGGGSGGPRAGVTAAPPPVVPVPPRPAKPPPPPAPVRLREANGFVFVGSGVLRSASTTCSPTLSPEVIWVSTGPMAPTVTRTRTGLPAWRTVTKLAAPIPSTADVGTVTAPLTLARVIDT